MVQEGNAGPSRQPANGEAAAPAPQVVVDRHAFVRTEEEDDAPMRIVKDYQRPSARLAPLRAWGGPGVIEGARPGLPFCQGCGIWLTLCTPVFLASSRFIIDGSV